MWLVRHPAKYTISEIQDIKKQPVHGSNPRTTVSAISTFRIAFSLSLAPIDSMLVLFFLHPPFRVFLCDMSDQLSSSDIATLSGQSALLKEVKPQEQYNV